MKPELCPQDVWERAEMLVVSVNGDATESSIFNIACTLLEAHQRGKNESQAEIDRLNKVIERMQQTMNSQAEQWTRSMAEAERRGMEEAARRELPALPEELHEHYAVMSVQTHEHFVKEYAKSAIRAKAQEVKT